MPFLIGNAIGAWLSVNISAIASQGWAAIALASVVFAFFAISSLICVDGHLRKHCNQSSTPGFIASRIAATMFGDRKLGA